jgi:hypothetical protein
MLLCSEVDDCHFDNCGKEEEEEDWRDNFYQPTS